MSDFRTNGVSRANDQIMDHVSDEPLNNEQEEIASPFIKSNHAINANQSKPLPFKKTTRWLSKPSMDKDSIRRLEALKPFSKYNKIPASGYKIPMDQIHLLGSAACFHPSSKEAKVWLKKVEQNFRLNTKEGQIKRTLRAIWDTAKKDGMRYSTDPECPEIGHPDLINHIRPTYVDSIYTPETLLKYKSGDCEDFAQFAGATLRARGIPFVIIGSTYHSFAAIVTTRRQAELEGLSFYPTPWEQEHNDPDSIALVSIDLSIIGFENFDLFLEKAYSSFERTLSSNEPYISSPSGTIIFKGEQFKIGHNQKNIKFQSKKIRSNDNYPTNKSLSKFIEIMAKAHEEYFGQTSYLDTKTKSRVEKKMQVPNNEISLFTYGLYKHYKIETNNSSPKLFPFTFTLNNDWSGTNIFYAFTLMRALGMRVGWWHNFKSPASIRSMTSLLKKGRPLLYIVNNITPKLCPGQALMLVGANEKKKIFYGAIPGERTLYVIPFADIALPGRAVIYIAPEKETDIDKYIKSGNLREINPVRERQPDPIDDTYKNLESQKELMHRLVNTKKS